MTAVENQIVVDCPNGHRFRVKGRADGLQVRCPTCKTPVTVRREIHTPEFISNAGTEHGKTTGSFESQNTFSADPILNPAVPPDFLTMDLPPQLPTGPQYPVATSVPKMVASDSVGKAPISSESEPAAKQTYAQAAIVLLGLLLAVQLFGFAISISKTTKWEYKLESPSDINFESAVARMGDQGWELVFARRATSSYGSAGYEMIFKRPK